MNKSKFQFSNPVLSKVSFNVYNHFNPEEFDGIVMDSNTEVQIIDDQHANVRLTVNVGKGIPNQPFDISIEMSADFSWGSTIQEDTVHKMLRINGSAVLLSYIRPIIANLTNSSQYPSLNIPFIDFTDE